MMYAYPLAWTRGLQTFSTHNWASSDKPSHRFADHWSEKTRRSDQCVRSPRVRRVRNTTLIHEQHLALARYNTNSNEGPSDLLVGSVMQQCSSIIRFRLALERSNLQPLRTMHQGINHLIRLSPSSLPLPPEKLHYLVLTSSTNLLPTSISCP